MGKLPSTHGEEAQSSTSPSLRSPAFPRALQQRHSLRSCRGSCRPPSRGSCSEGSLGTDQALQALRTARPGRGRAWPLQHRARPLGLSSARERFQQAEKAAAESLRMAAPAARPTPHVPALPVGRWSLLRDAGPRSRGARAGGTVHGLCKQSAVSATAGPGPAVTPRPALTYEWLPGRPATRGCPAAGRTADDVLQERGGGRVRAGPHKAGAATTPGAHQHGARAPPGRQQTGQHAEPSPLRVRLRALGLRVLHDQEGRVLLREARVQLAAPAALHAGRPRLRDSARPYAARPSPNPAALPAAAILPRANWRARSVRPALLPGRCGRGGNRHRNPAGWELRAARRGNGGGLGAAPPARPLRESPAEAKNLAFSVWPEPEACPRANGATWRTWRARGRRRSGLGAGFGPGSVHAVPSRSPFH